MIKINYYHSLIFFNLCIFLSAFEYLRYNSLLKSLLIGNCILMNRDNAKLLLNLFLKFYIPVKPIKLTNNIPECYDFLESCFLSKNINNNDIIID